MRLCLLTNQAYALPTIITTSDLAHLNIFDIISVIKYPDFQDNAFDASIYRIGSKSAQKIELITLKDSPFKNFSGSFHFPDIVFAKLLLPCLFPDEIIAFIDSGFIVTNKRSLKKWFQEIETSFRRSNLSMGMPTATWKPNNQWSVNGQFIIFNKKEFESQKILSRLVGSFNELLPTGSLQMPEQDLVNLTIGKDELFPIFNFPNKTSDLVLFAELTNRGIISARDLVGKCALFKFVGSFKPWHYWVTNPDKQIFLKRVAEVSHLLDIPLLKQTSFYQVFPNEERMNWAVGQYYHYSTYLSDAGVVHAKFKRHLPRLKCLAHRLMHLTAQLPKFLKELILNK